MIRCVIAVLLCLMGFCHSYAQTWDEWFEQRKTQRKYLLQQIAKLQLYLSYVKKGYDIAGTGLSLVGSIKNGDFLQHALFIDDLRLVKGNVRRYAKIADIMRMQSKMLASYRTFLPKITTPLWTSSEIIYIHQVATNILGKLADDLDHLSDVITNGKLAMDDKERLDRIDHIHQEVTDRYMSLQALVTQTDLLRAHRAKEQQQLEILQQQYKP